MGRRELVIVGKVVLCWSFAVLLQIVLISHISVLGVTADLFLILTVIVAVCRGSLEGAIFGFFAGLIADIAYFSAARGAVPHLRPRRLLRGHVRGPLRHGEALERGPAGRGDLVSRPSSCSGSSSTSWGPAGASSP